VSFPGNVPRIITRTAAAAVVLLVLGLAWFRVAAADRESLNRALACPVGGRFVRAGDVQMFVQEDGPPGGPAVLFVHGPGAWSQIWRRTMDTLAANGFRVVAVDIPPFGFSERPVTADYGDEAQGRRILEVAEALHLTGVTLVGHSFGARPAMEAYFLDSLRFSRIVLIDAALGLDEMGAVRPQKLALRTLLAIAPLRNALVAATLTNPNLTRKLLRRLVSEQSAVTPEQIAMFQRQFTVEHTTAALGAWLRTFLLSHERSLAVMRPLYESMGVPTLVLWGDSDSVTPVAQGRDLAKLIPAAKLVELPGVGHMPVMEAPDQFDAALLAFLGSGNVNSTTPADPAPPSLATSRAQQKRRP
jgi:pimeloyl-ACP methyl ester carboxylesterase